MEKKDIFTISIGVTNWEEKKAKRIVFFGFGFSFTSYAGDALREEKKKKTNSTIVARN
jgi:hypothetical protein